MMRYMLLPVLPLALLLTLATGPAATPAAAQGFEQLTYSNVVKTLARFGALQFVNDGVLDDFAKLNDCDNYHKNYRDDFAMQTRRGELRKEIRNKLHEYPDSYYFTSGMRLDRYDFRGKTFRLQEMSRLVNVNRFKLVEMDNRGICVKGERIRTLPEEIGVMLDQPVTLEGLPLAEGQAKALLDRMNARGNHDRAIWARFSVMVVFAKPIPLGEARAARYNAEAQLLTIEFFEDKAMTKPIWVYTRS